jgi:TLD
MPSPIHSSISTTSATTASAATEVHSPPLASLTSTVQSTITAKELYSLMGCGCSLAASDDRSMVDEVYVVDRPARSVLTPMVHQELRKYLPRSIAQENFWIKYSMDRDGDSYKTLLSKIHGSRYTILGIETSDGQVFGAFCSTPWRVQRSWFGTGETFLWKLKHPRMIVDGVSYESSRPQEVQVYKYTGANDMVQHCTNSFMAVGGGDFGNATDYKGIDMLEGCGLLINSDLTHGESLRSSTFGNPCLSGPDCKHGRFVIDKLEVWTMTSFGSIAEAKEFESRLQFIEQHGRTQ